MLNRIMKEDAGVLTFEWILLVTILVIGVIAGLAAVRDALDIELADIAQAAGNVNQSYSYSGLATTVVGGTSVAFNTNTAATGQPSSSASHTVNASTFTDGVTTVTIATK